MTPADSPDEEVEEKVGEKEEEEESSDQRAEGEVHPGGAPVKEEDTKVLKSRLSGEQTEKEPSKRGPISSFFGEERWPGSPESQHLFTFTSAALSSEKLPGKLA